MSKQGSKSSARMKKQIIKKSKKTFPPPKQTKIKTTPNELSSIESYLEILSDFTAIVDSKGIIINSSRPTGILKNKKQIFKGKNIFLFYKNEDSNFPEAAKKKKKFSTITKFQYAKDKDIPVLSRWSVIPNTGKDKYFLVLNFILESSGKVYSEEFLHNIEGEFTWSSKTGIKDRRLVYSENLFKVTGYTQTEIKRKAEGILSIIHEEEYSAVKKEYDKFIDNATQDSLRLVYRIERKDKKHAWLKEVIFVKRNSTGKPVSSKGVISDVTDLMKADEGLVKTIEKIKKQNVSKDKFISMLSHDLRAPFTSILGFSEILITEQSLSNAEKLEYLTYIHESSQNQLQLINYLLDWSRLQTGRMKIDSQRLHAQTIVFNCVSSLTGNAIRKNLDIKVKVSDKIYVQADERLLGQVITNLLSNAIKFSPPNTTIEINANPFNDELTEFIVKDQGIGISDDNKEKLFKIERMFSTEGTKGEKGTGLGLSLVKEIVEKHKGDIWFYSEAGKGSEFHFTVQRSQNIILLVDNNEDDKKLYIDLIRKNFPAFRIISTSNGYEAMTIVLDKLPSLVITEHEMPLMNGMQLIESIRREEKNYTTPVILTTAEFGDSINRLYQNLNVFAMLRKPINTDHFIEKLDLALQI